MEHTMMKNIRKAAGDVFLSDHALHHARWTLVQAIEEYTVTFAPQIMDTEQVMTDIFIRSHKKKKDKKAKLLQSANAQEAKATRMQEMAKN